MKVKHYYETIEVSHYDNKELQGILDIEEGYAEDYGRDEVIETFSTVFETEQGEYGVDIKVCNGDTPYVDPVLFSVVNHEGMNHWHEIYPLDVDDELLGEYVFEHDVEEDNVKLYLHVNVVLEKK